MFKSSRMLLSTVGVLIFLFESSLAFKLVSRDEWGASKPKERTTLKVNPPSYVVIHHTATYGCSNETKCKKLVKSIQNFHMTDSARLWDDIGYNFLIGEDGNVYVGRDWGIQGAHAKSFNPKSIGIAMLGNFTDHLPDSSAMEALRDLISYGVEKNYIEKNYKLIGHRQAQIRDCPGDRLFDELKTWDHWSDEWHRN